MKQCACQPGFVPGPNNPKQINGCSIYGYITTVLLPANLGDDSPTNMQWGPKKGRWTDKVVVYVANGAAYFYDHEGVYTQLSMGHAGVQSVNGQSGIVTLPDLTLMMGERSLGKYNAGKPVTISLPIPEAGQIAEGDTGYVTGDLAYKLHQAVDQAIENEVAARELEDTKLNDSITNLTSTVDNNTTAITTTQQNVTRLENNLSTTIQFNTTVSSTPEAVSLDKTMGELNNTSTSTQSVELPLASDSSAGIITAEMYRALVQLLGQ